MLSAGLLTFRLQKSLTKYLTGIEQQLRSEGLPEGKIIAKLLKLKVIGWQEVEKQVQGYLIRNGEELH